MYILLTFISVFDAGFISFESRVVSNKLIHGGDHGGSCQVPCLRAATVLHQIYVHMCTRICVYIYIYRLFIYICMNVYICMLYIYAYMYTHAFMYIPTWENHGHIHLQWDISWGTIYVVKIIASSTIPLYIPWPRPKGINRELSCSFNGIINHWQTIMTKMTLLGGIV